MSTEYPEDEFDIDGRQRTPQGVHRRARSRLAAVLPFVAVLVIVPLLAWAAVTALSRDPGTPEPAAGPTPTATEAPADPTATPTGTEAPSGEPSEEPTEEPAGDVERGVSISVLNGAGIGGLAADAAGELIDDGFTNAVAADYTAGSPETTTLYYRNAELRATAEAIGELLGIDTLVEAPSATQNVEIAIVLRADYA
ncbi:LytR C-terminal domain-containing protein [Georgenia faecalis]|uniref:LytR C-terminal domain-containing protein n=1 Tax=Georgenia faecalis TaxID=2483799 RepID=A0ABV9D6Y3_9MICO|nr:LytR C-terminal domain-containing protein [Georgenia faecalis]